MSLSLCLSVSLGVSLCLCLCLSVSLSLSALARSILPIIYISAAVKRGVSVLQTRTIVNKAVGQYTPPPVQLGRCRGTIQNYTGRQVLEAPLTPTRRPGNYGYETTRPTTSVEHPTPLSVPSFPPSLQPSVLPLHFHHHAFTV